MPSCLANWSLLPVVDFMPSRYSNCSVCLKDNWIILAKSHCLTPWLFIYYYFLSSCMQETELFQHPPQDNDGDSQEWSYVHHLQIQLQHPSSCSLIPQHKHTVILRGCIRSVKKKKKRRKTKQHCSAHNGFPWRKDKKARLFRLDWTTLSILKKKPRAQSQWPCL